MTHRKHTPKYTAEFRERGGRLFREQRPDYTSDNAAYWAIASKLGCSHDTLRAWCLQAAQNLARPASRGKRHRAMHRRAPDESNGDTRRLRGKKVITTNLDATQPCPDDRVNREFVAAKGIIGLFKTEVINFLGPWKSNGQVKWETLNWVSWYNTERLHRAIGYITPQEAGDVFYENTTAHDKVA